MCVDTTTRRKIAPESCNPAATEGFFARSAAEYTTSVTAGMSAIAAFTSVGFMRREAIVAPGAAFGRELVWALVRVVQLRAWFSRSSASENCLSKMVSALPGRIVLTLRYSVVAHIFRPRIRFDRR